MFTKVITFCKENWLEISAYTVLSAIYTLRLYNEVRVAGITNALSPSIRSIEESACRLEAITKNGGTILFTNAEIIRGKTTTVSDAKTSNT